MENKILVELMVPELEVSYDVFIPVTKRVGNLIALLVKAISELGIEYEFDIKLALYNRFTAEKYSPNSLVYETNIKNGTILILM